MHFFHQIRKKIKIIYDSIGNENLKRNFLNALPFWIGSVVTGLIAVLYANLFYWAERGTSYIFNQAEWSFFLITPFCFVLAWWLTIKFAPYSKGSGIPQVTASIELSNPKHHYKVDKLLSIRIVFIKIISSLVMVLGGGVIGREGPTIQISASIFKKINDWLPTWYPKVSKRNMIVTGAAAGLAAAFNTPLGGIVFAIEELTKTHFSFFKSALLTGVIIAGLTALKFFGPYLYLGYPKLDNIQTWIISIVLLMALVTGFLGCGMGKVILFVLNKKSTFKTNFSKITFTIFCGIIVASLAFFIDSRTFGSGKEIMVTTLFTDNKHLEWYIPLLRIAGPIVSFSTGAAGGIFAPSLSAGAAIGAVVSGWFHLSGTETNLIILCGMTGFLTGITKSPFTSAILVSEMTNSHDIIFYLMVTALIANLVSTYLSKHSFYDQLKDQYIKDIHQSECQQNSDEEFIRKV
ncbi:MAG: chloride channel protein [Ferruginibacter sp.]